MGEQDESRKRAMTGGAGPGFRTSVAAAVVLVLLATFGYAATRPSGRSGRTAQKVSRRAEKAGVTLKRIKASAKTGKPAAKGPSANGGQTIELAGTGFKEPLSVEFFGFAGSAFVVNPTKVEADKRVTVVVPEAAVTGPVRIVDGASGPSNTLKLQVVPEVKTLTPASVVVGGRLFLDGSGFSFDSVVYFPGLPRPVAANIVSPTRIDVVVPAGVRAGKLTVGTSGGRSKPVKLAVGAAKDTGRAAPVKRPPARRARR